jgi:hypothetical protein
MSPSPIGLPCPNVCDVCKRDGYYFDLQQPTRIVCRQAHLRVIDDVNAPWEQLRNGVLEPKFEESILPTPMLLVTPDVRRVFLDAGVTCLH